MSLFEHDDNAIGQTEAISNIYATVIPSKSIPPRPTAVLQVILIRPDGCDSFAGSDDQRFILSDHHSQSGAKPDVKLLNCENC